MFCAVQLSKTRTMQVPLPGAAEDKVLTIPEPALLIGIAVRDNLLSDTLAATIKKAMPTIAESVTNGVTYRSLALPLPMPLPLSPTFATHKGMLLFGSTPAVVTAAIMAAEKGGGLKDAPAFQKAFDGLPLDKNNGVDFVDPRFIETMVAVQTRMMEMAGEEGGPGAAFFKKLMQRRGPLSSAMVVINEPAGVVVRGTTSSGGREVVMQAAIAPLSLMAAIAIPSFVKARTSSRQNACINNLRMLDGAKDQAAMEAGLDTGAEPPDLDKVLQYIKGAKMPVCPQGGQYTLKPISESPECTLHGSL